MKPAWPTPSSRPTCFIRIACCWPASDSSAIEGILQNQDNVISVKAERVQPLFVTKAETVSHDFH